MPWEERGCVIQNLESVDKVIEFDDSDGTVCEAIRRLRPTYFANGGDRGRSNTPEQDVCEELGVEMLWSIGGDEKRDSSSDLVERVRKEGQTPIRNNTKHSGR